jgi:hypothetical protein
VAHGSVTFKSAGGDYENSQFNVYSAGGTWTLRSMYIYDLMGNITSYDQAALTPLFNRLTINVTNKGTPDLAPPLVTAGQVLTPKVSISSHPYFLANLTVSDNVSGVVRAYVTVTGPGGSPSVLYYKFTTVPVRNGTVQVYDYLGDQTATGTWTISAYQACDVVNQCAYVADPADIHALFGTTTFKLVH